MIVFGVELPTLAVAVGSLVGAFIVGIGVGLSSEITKYFVQKHLIKKFDNISTRLGKIVTRLYKK